MLGIGLDLGLAASGASTPAPPVQFGTPYNLGSNNTGSTNTNVVVVTTLADAAAGDEVVVSVEVNNVSTTINTVTDSVGGNTWAPTPQLTGGNSRFRMFYSKLVNPLPTGATITATMSASNTNLKAMAAGGVSGVNARDLVPTGATGSSNAPSPGATGTLSENDEIIFVGIRADATITNPITEAAGYTRLSQTGGSQTTQLSYLIVTSNATTTPQWGLNASVTWLAQAVTFTKA